MTYEIIDQLPNKETYHYIDSLGEYHTTEISLQITGHSQKHHQNRGNKRTYVRNQIEQGTQKCNNNCIFDPED